MIYLPKISCAVFILTICFSPALTLGDDMTQREREFFEEKIRPVLVKHCYECHSAKSDTMDGDYSVDTRMGVRAAGSSGEVAIIPGDPNNSPLLKALNYDEMEMPPDGKLPDSIIADFEKWIKMGAPDPRAGDPFKMRQQADKKKSEQLWSLNKPRFTRLPKVKNKKWSQHPVDRFVLAQMEKKQLHPVADASATALLRRVYFDLIGLPPSPEAVEAFTKNPTKKEYEKVVDSLLKSPRFGERWGRHWLDLARYAESSGMEFNFTYPHAWPYRDYVINAFNKDKPYDRFITEQLAGDLLEAKSQAEKEENLIATGFLAVGPKRHNASGTEFKYDLADDQIKTVSKTFLGLTVACARCHDHKFDPIPTKDYYALGSIFQSTKTLYGTKTIKYSNHPSKLIPFGENAEELNKNYLAHLDQVNKLNIELKKTDGLRLTLENKDVAKQDKKAIAEAKEKIKSLKEQIKKLEKNAPKQPKYAMGVEAGKPIDLTVAVGGNPSTKGVKAPRGFLSAVSVQKTPTIDSKSCGRLELARWMTDPSNPIVSRVMVNRIWQHLFGAGIVQTPNNFGAIGKPPTHPELLDFLAITFIENKWSVKKMIRMIVLSRTYQLSTDDDKANANLDPQNVYLWKASARRLEVEPIRDAILAISGELDLTPAQGSTVTPIGQKLARDVPYDKINPPNNKKRTVYAPIVRNYEPHIMQEFNFASSSLVVGQRATTTTAKQALFFLNNDFILQQSDATARLLLKKNPENLDACIRLAYLRALNRQPTATELNTANKYLELAEKTLIEKQSDAAKRRQLALASFVQMVFSSAEFRYLIQPPNEQQTTVSN